MNRQEELNKRYEHLGVVPRMNPSLRSFLKSEPLSEWLRSSLSRGPACEIGCGAQAVFSSLHDLFPGYMTRELEACDLSNVAIEKAQMLEGNVHYFTHDILRPFPRDDYSLILDAHCLHTLTSLPELFQAMGNIKSALSEGGLLVGEVMMAHKNMTLEEGFFYSKHECVLYKYDRPSRVFMTAMEWEDFFLNCGMAIQYFMCQSSIKFIPHDQREDPMPGDPECLRFVLKKE